MALDPTKSLGQFRLKIADLDDTRRVMDDTMAGGYLAAYGLAGTESAADTNIPVLYAAADALEAIAASEVMVSKVIRTQDLSTNGAQVAAELRNLAASYRTRAADADDTSFYVGVAEYTPYPRGGAEAAERGWV